MWTDGRGISNFCLRHKCMAPKATELKSEEVVEGDLQKMKGVLVGKLKSKKKKPETSLSSEGLLMDKASAGTPPPSGEYVYLWSCFLGSVGYLTNQPISRIVKKISSRTLRFRPLFYSKHLDRCLLSGCRSSCDFDKLNFLRHCIFNLIVSISGTAFDKRTYFFAAFNIEDMGSEIM